MEYICSKVKVKHTTSLDRPSGFQEVEAPRFQDNRHMKVIRSALSTGRLYPQEISLLIISVTGWVDPGYLVRQGGICQWKIPAAPSGIEPATFRLVAQCLNQLRHHVQCKSLRYVFLCVSLSFSLFRWRIAFVFVCVFEMADDSAALLFEK